MADALFSPDTADIPGHKVYLGVWTNWSRGPVFGATLTLNRNAGTLLISFTAFFVTVVASRFWRIACSVLHRQLSTTEYRDALHHQRQAIFRNSSSSGSGLWSFIQISWAWRGLALTRKNLSRTLPHIVFAAICLLAFSFASGFSSSISTAVGDEVLIDGTNCGYVDRHSITTKELIQVLNPWIASVVSNAANYAQQVYSPNKTGVLTDSTFIRKRLNTISNTEAPCPFKDNMCQSSTSNLLLDTGYINICRDLGINLPKNQCFAIREVVHCAPLETTGRSEPTDYAGVSNYTGYKYGPSYKASGEFEAGNYTIITEDVYSQNKIKATGANDFGYGLVSVLSQTVNGSVALGTFYPHPDLQRPDADIFIYFLSGNGVLTSARVDDPWYRSNVPSTTNAFYELLANGTFQLQETFQPAEAASPLGCASQLQICKDPSALSSTCGPLASYNDAFAGALISFAVDREVYRNATTLEQIVEASASDEEASRWLWLVMTLNNYPNQFGEAVSVLGFQSLDSRRGLVNGLQGPLPNDQWKMDVSNWWNISLAGLQASVVETANGITDPALVRLKRNATNPGQKKVCQNQKILSTSHTSVSLFGLYFTYILGTIIIVTSFVLDPILSYAQKRWKNREYENLEWACNETLQLQRLAYEESGQGEWSKCIDSIPVTAADQELAPLNLSDPKHPLLHQTTSLRPSKEISEHSDAPPEVHVIPSDDQENAVPRGDEDNRDQCVASGSSPIGIEELLLEHVDPLLGDESTNLTPSPLLTAQRHSVVCDPENGQDQPRLHP